MPVPMTNPRRMPMRIPAPRPPSKTVHVIGMHGMGDNLHQRAIVRELMQRFETVYLETPWPSIYWDLPSVKLLRKPTKLRTQAKNMVRQSQRYSPPTPQLHGSQSIRIWYSGDMVYQCGSVLAAMCVTAGVKERDFSLPVPSVWISAARALLKPTTKPILMYRPLVVRTEWSGCSARNPLTTAYEEILGSIHDYFHIVSVADLVPEVEWRVDHVVADQEFHHGELTFEELAGMMHIADLSFASPGFATILAQAVGTPSVCVFGGYENSTSFMGGKALAPYLGIDPIDPCHCFKHNHACRKEIDVPRAITRLYQFVETNVRQDPVCEDPQDARQLEFAFETVHEPGRTGDADYAGGFCGTSISD